jgi:hypothetical protein
VIPLEEQPIYTEDWIGLRELAQDDRLHFGTIPNSEHVQEPEIAIKSNTLLSFTFPQISFKP